MTSVVLAVANTFLQYAKRDNISVTPMKLQKLVYILYKTYLQKYKSKLFSDIFSVWKYGPVQLDVYNAFKKYKSNAIDDYYYEDGKFYTLKLKGNGKLESTFNEVWDKYKDYSGIYLSKLTHLEGTAWEKAKSKELPYILDEDILKEQPYEWYLK